MSYASGLMMGTAIVQALRQMLGGTSSFEQMGKMNAFGKMKAQDGSTVRMKSGVMELVSSLPGRRRYRIAGMNDAQSKLLEETLGKLSYMTEVKANPVSGSLLLIYDETRKADVDQLAEALEKILQRNLSPSPLPSLISPQPGAITHSVRQAMFTLSRWLKQNTGGVLDANSLASLVFFLTGVRKLLLTQQFPSGTQLLWWAFSLMRGWKD